MSKMETIITVKTIIVSAIFRLLLSVALHKVRFAVFMHACQIYSVAVQSRLETAAKVNRRSQKPHHTRYDYTLAACHFSSNEILDSICSFAFRALENFWGNAAYEMKSP